MEWRNATQMQQEKVDYINGIWPLCKVAIKMEERIIFLFGEQLSRERKLKSY